MNMLSAKKVRIHGMQSSRWTTRDKLTQYKGLINLYTRDRKILSFDNAVNRKKQTKELKQLRKDIKTCREDLDNAVQGDRQQLRNTLAEHRDLQLTFQNLPPIKAIDHLHQGNFNKRKLLDRMDYKMKQKTQTLINLKLELAELQDRVTYGGDGTLPVEKAAQLITGKVQDATLKKEAALACNQTYRKILNILKKDSLYFDAVLETLKLDGFLQGRCMVRTTELGQLATEYLDDRKQEFKELERAVKRDMKARELSLKVVRQEVDILTKNMSNLIRKDSDINLGKVIIPLTGEDNALRYDIECIEHILTDLKDTVFVSTFENIYTWSRVELIHTYICSLVEQQAQSDRLQELLEKCITNRDNLAKKRDHGQTMHMHLLYTMHTTTFEYKTEKARIQEEIQTQLNRKRDVKKVDLHQKELLVKVRSSLQQLLVKCAIVMIPEKNEKSTIKVAVRAPVKRVTSASSIILPPPELEQDGLDIIAKLSPKLQILMQSAVPALDPDKMDTAYKFFQQLTLEIYPTVQYEKFVAEDSLVTDIYIEDASVPTYADIKAKSKELVDISTVDEDLIPMFTPKKKKLKLK